MSSMLKKKEFVTIITPIPGFIPRQLAIDILHAHSEVITLNPLVLDHKPIKAPRDAASDEFYSTWYEITERIQYVPGFGRMGSGKIAFKGCFHDMPWGLQAHIYAPMGTDLRYKYRIGGNQPGVEPPETREMGLTALGAPADGLYLREDVEVKCGLGLMSFVKSQIKAASKLMVQRIIKKAELVDAGVLHAMIEDGKLRTVNPQDRSQMSPIVPASPSPVLDKSSVGDQAAGPKAPQRHSTIVPSTPGSPPPVPYQVVRPQSMQQNPYSLRPGSGGMAQQQQTPTRLGVYGVSPGFVDYSAAYPGQPSYPGRPGFYDPRQQQQQQQQQQQHQQFMMAQQQNGYMPYGQMPTLQQPQHAELAAAASAGPPAPLLVEMPGDYYHQQQQQQQPQTNNINRDSNILAQGQWSVPPASNSRPGSSTSSDAHASPGLDKSFSSNLATHREEQHENRQHTLEKLDPAAAAERAAYAQS